MVFRAPGTSCGAYAAASHSDHSDCVPRFCLIKAPSVKPWCGQPCVEVLTPAQVACAGLALQRYSSAIACKGNPVRKGLWLKFSEVAESRSTEGPGRHHGKWSATALGWAGCPEGWASPARQRGPLLTGFIQNKSTKLETRVYIHAGTQGYVYM